MFQFPRTIAPRRRFYFGCLGIIAFLGVWFAITLPVFPVEYERTRMEPNGRFEVRPDPITGEPVKVELYDIRTVREFGTEALVNPPALDRPDRTFRDAWTLLWEKEPSLWRHMGRSTARILLGFLISSIIAVPLGVMMGLFPHLRALVMPIVSFLRPLPSISWVPLAIIWLGADEVQKLAIVFMGTFSAALIYTVEATLKVDPSLIKAAENLGVSSGQMLRKVLLPAALPNIVSGLKVVMAIGWTCVISAEIVGTKEGLGALIWQSKETSDTAAVLVGMVCISGIVLALDLLTTWVERLVVPWVFVERNQ